MTMTMNRLIWALFSALDLFYFDRGLYALLSRECLPFGASTPSAVEKCENWFGCFEELCKVKNSCASAGFLRQDIAVSSLFPYQGRI